MARVGKKASRYEQDTSVRDAVAMETAMLRSESGRLFLSLMESIIGAPIEVQVSHPAPRRVKVGLKVRVKTLSHEFSLRCSIFHFAAAERAATFSLTSRGDAAVWYRKEWKFLLVSSDTEVNDYPSVLCSKGACVTTGMAGNSMAITQRTRHMGEWVHKSCVVIPPPRPAQASV